jgi:hypothetical protein
MVVAPVLYDTLCSKGESRFVLREDETDIKFKKQVNLGITTIFLGNKYF